MDRNNLRLLADNNIITDNVQKLQYKVNNCNDNRGNWVVNINKINASQNTKGNNPQTLADNNNITNTVNNFNPNVNTHEENPNIYYQNAATNYQEQFENVKANLNYKQFVNKVFDNKLTKQEKSKPFQIGKTPDKLIQSGFPDNNISIGYKIIEKAQDNRNPDHNLSKETIREVYQALDNPIAIIKAEQNKNEKTPNNRYSVVVDLKDDAEKYVLVAFDINKKDGNTLLNDIRSIHSRKDYTPLIDKAFNENRLIKVDRDKIKDLLTPKIQPDIISGGVASLIDNINQQTNNVKFFQSALDYDYITNQVTGEKINIEMNEDIKADKIEPQEISSNLSFKISQKPSDNKKSLINSLGLNNGNKIEVTNITTNEKGIVSKETIEKSISNISKHDKNYSDKIIILNNIETVFKTSQLILTHDDAKTKTQIKIKRYVNIANINGRNYLLEIIGKNNGELLIYSIDVMDTKNSGTRHALNKSQQQYTAINSISNIKDIFKTKLVQKYNNDYKNLQSNNTFYQGERLNVVDWTDKFDKVPTFAEIEKHIKDIIDSGEVFDTLSPDWKIDIKGGNRVVDKITNAGNFQKLKMSPKKRHNKYVAGIKELINNSQYSHSDKNNKPKEKPNIENYHYFDVNVKIGDKSYWVRLECEENKKSSSGNYAKRSMPPL